MALNYTSLLTPPNPTQSVMGGVQRGLELAGLIENMETAKYEREQQQALQTELATLSQNPSASKIAELMVRYPQMGSQFKTTYDVLSEEERNQRLQQGTRVFSALQAGRPDLATSILEENAEAYENAGRTKEAQTFRDLEKLIRYSPETATATTGIFLAHAMGPENFADTYTKLEQERRNKAEFPLLQQKKRAEIAKAQSDAEVAAIEAKYADQMNKLKLRKAEKELTEQTGLQVQSSNILPDGTAVTVMKDGSTRVIGPDGVELTGQERVDAVKTAQEFGADVQAWRAGGRTGATIGQKEAQKAFESIGKIQSNISNLDSAIAALDAGANTGVIASRFPNWKASSIELQNIQRQLGLDVIGSVTFGALSEGELSLALETALPLNMDEPDLKDWLTRKKESQRKLADYLTEQARYLSVPGRTVGDWIEYAQSMAQTGTAGGVSVTTPDGMSITFPTQGQADAFKRAAGMQ